MTSSRPYLVRALYQWITDNGLTPHLVVDINAQGLEAPIEYAENGKLILNVAPQAIRNFAIEDEGVGFNARFRGTPTQVWLPIHAILAIYARENGQGMVFADEAEPTPEPEPPKPKRQRPQLRVVK